jgi:outer membrane autotransporter protein
MPVMAAIYGRHLIDTLHERVGDEHLSEAANLAWGRIIGFYGHRDGHPLGIYGGGPEFSYGFGALQAGLDVYARERANGGLDRAGLYAAFGHGQGDATHNLLGSTIEGGEDTFDAVSLAGYWTHFGAGGWYLDGVVQGTWYDTTMTGDRGLRAGETDGWGLAASIEGGYPFDLGDGWRIEPQAQLVYQTLDFADFNDGAADVRYSDLVSLAGRVGARLSRSWTLDSGEGNGGDGQLKATAWLRADLWHEFLGKPTTEFSSAEGFVPFTADFRGSWAKVGIGGSFDLRPGSSIYGNVNYERTFDGDAYAWEGKLGFKVKW